MNNNDNFITFITIYYSKPFGDVRVEINKLFPYVIKILTRLCTCYYTC